MDKGQFITALASIIVAVVAALAAYASSKSAAKASTINSELEKRATALDEAYERAKQFDVDTIKRLKEDNKELREKDALRDTEMSTMRVERRADKAEIRRLKARVAHLEQVVDGQTHEDEGDDDT